MRIKFSFSWQEFQRASLRARPLLLQSADSMMNVELIGPLQVSMAQQGWLLTSPGVIDLNTRGSKVRIPVERCAFKLGSSSLTGHGSELSLPIMLTHLHLAGPNKVSEREHQLLAEQMWEAQRWRLKVLPIAQELQGGSDNLLSSTSFQSGELSLFRDTGEFAVELETFVHVNSDADREATPLPEKSTPANALVLTSDSETNIPSERLAIPRCMRAPRPLFTQLPMPIEARGQQWSP